MTLSAGPCCALGVASQDAVGMAGFDCSHLPCVLISLACQTPFDTLFKGVVELQMGLIQLPSAASC